MEQRVRPPILPLESSGLGYAVRGQILITGLSLELRATGSTLILGPNGAGKTLFLRLCHGLLQPTTGSLRWAGRTPGQTKFERAMVFQKPVLLRRSARANIDYALCIQGTGRAERRARSHEALEMTGLARVAARSARILSGGEQQRLAIARAWVIRPQVMLLDEPTSKLDPRATQLIEELITTIRRAGTEVIMTTHDLGQARRLGDQVVFMNHGQVLEHTEAGAFFQQPRSEAATAFIEGRLVP